MNEHAQAVVQATFEASSKGEIHFGEVIGRLAGVQVESYHVDYRSGRTTCYLPDGATIEVGFERPPQAIAEAFDAEGVRAAILGAQQGRVMYPEFKALSQRAGCVGYTVWIAGRHVSYTGRRGETHVEHFPR
jgi:uncharacterized protein YbcV (DUF1398 family)